MQINVQKYLDQAAADEVQHFETSVKPEQVKNAAEIKAALQPVADAVVDALKRNQLMRATLVVEGTVPTTISLETGIINMPLANAKKVANFFEVEEIVPVNVYLVTDNPFLNASGLRIDLLADSDTFAGATGKLLDNIAPHVLEQLQHIDEEAAKPAPDPAEKAVKKPAAKKTTRKTTRKATTKTTRKTAAKKPAAKKAAGKTTRTKKAAD